LTFYGTEMQLLNIKIRTENYNLVHFSISTILIIMCQYSTLVYSFEFNEMSVIKCEIYDQVTSLTLTLPLKPNPNPKLNPKPCL